MSTPTATTAPIATFRARSWNGKRGDFTCAPFRKAETNPDPEKFALCPASDLGNASRLWIEGGVEVWGWL